MPVSDAHPNLVVAQSPLSWPQLIEEATKQGADCVRYVKNAVLDADSPGIHLASAEETARLLVWLFFEASRLGLSELNTELKTTYAKYGDGPALEAVAARHPLKVLKRRDTDNVLAVKDGMPQLVDAPAKLQATLRAPWSWFVPRLPTELPEALTKMRRDIVTHPAKLRGSAAKGGFNAAGIQVPSREYWPLFCEHDFRTARRFTAVGSAGDHAWGVLLLGSIWWDGHRAPLSTLLAPDKPLTEAVSDVLRSHGLSPETLMSAFTSEKGDVDMYGEAQVFCGGLPTPTRVSVVVPYALSFEFERAVGHLNDCAAIERQPAEQALQAQITEVSAAIATASKVKKRELVARHKHLLGTMKELQSVRVWVPVVELPVGGSNPQNVAQGLTKSLHKQHVRAYVGRSVQTQPRALHAKSFHPESLFKEPTRLPSSRQFTTLFEAIPKRKADKLAFTELLLEMVESCAQALLDYRQQWRKRFETNGASLAQGACERIEKSDAPWALFIRAEQPQELTDAQWDALVGPCFTRIQRALETRYGKGIQRPERELREFFVRILKECLFDV